LSISFSGSLGLRSKFLLAVSLLLALTLGLTSLYMARMDERTLLDNLRAKGEALGQFVALVSIEPIYAFDITSLDRIVTQISKDREISFALILGVDGKMMTTVEPPSLSGETMAAVLSGRRMLDDLQLLRFPILDHGDRLGEVVIAMDYRVQRQLIQHNLVRQSVIYFGIIVFLGLVIFLIFHYSVLRQVSLLTGGANRIGSGNYDFQLPVLSGDELSRLTDCFNRMTREIREDQEGLRQANERLAQEVEQRRLAEEQLRLAASVFTYAREGISITDPQGIIIDVNEAFCDITGYSRAEVIGQNPRILQSGRHDAAFYQAMWNSLIQEGHWTGEVWNRRKNGDLLAELLTISAVKAENGQLLHYLALFSDISAQKAHEKQLEHIAHFDSLTNLPNRVLLADRLHQAMSLAQRRNQLLAVVYLDLDGFKDVNDTYGHDVGDQLLLLLALRMQHALRESDTIARLGGDEFVAVLMDLNSEAECPPLLERLLEAASEPMRRGGRELRVSASIGVAFYPQSEEINPDQLLRQADQAMYQAKLSGKNRYKLFDAERESHLRGRHESIERIDQAIRQQEFVLYYQPKVNMRLGRVVGAEALIRWQHPQEGLLSPHVFLPILEDHPLSVTLGEWVIETALLQLEQWQDQGLDVPLSVNIGAYHLQQPDFMERLRGMLQAHPRVNPGQLELEIVETSTLQDMRHAAKVITDCLDLGIEFALDDFGTGYSSLIYLKSLPVRHLKVDQTFVRDMLDDADDLAIVEGVLGLATAFQRRAVAEGVETLEHGSLLLRLGCEIAQGYGIARPMPAQDVPSWCEQWLPAGEWRQQQVINRENLPVMFAMVEHRAWFQSIENCLQGKCAVPALLDHHQCRFGSWFDEVGEVKYAGRVILREFKQHHERIHRAAREILELQAQGDNQQALQRLPELRGMKVRLLEQMNVLLNG
jgi:diguanylate cyclase (GGDEF)-like protein/PAS domain S-box-containing protein